MTLGEIKVVATVIMKVIAMFNASKEIYYKLLAATKAAYKYVVWRKCSRVSESDQLIRMSICYICPSIRQKNDSPYPFMKYVCAECGCMLRLKTWCIDEKCPLNKW